jgi:hypothetical protein
MRWLLASSLLALIGLSSASADHTGATARLASGRVFLVSLDGLGHLTQTLDADVSEELRTLHALTARGVQAAGLVPHVPSTTANTHAAIWTGAWGDVNGITGNSMPPAPRHAHSAFDRIQGFGSEPLRAEPLWLTAARQGVRTVVQQASQSYPFIPATVGDRPDAPLVILHGYQTRLLSPARFLRQADVRTVACETNEADTIRCVAWKSGPATLTGRLVRHPQHGFAMRITTGTDAGAVIAPAAPAEDTSPRTRPLARHFSDGLLVNVPDTPPVTLYFRLFEVAPDGSDFLLYHTPLHELALYDGGRDTRARVLRLLQEEGGFLGNGAGYEWEREQSALGLAAWRGGDGTSERRYLETLEVAMRQNIRHARWLVRTYQPDLFVGYTSLPDEMEHRWMGLAVHDQRYAAFRRWGYQLVDLTAAAFADLAGGEDHLLFVSDHGLAVVTHDVNINAALRDAGLLTADARGGVVPAATRAMYVRNCVMVHTDDWKDGVVPVADRRQVMDEVAAVLRRLRDPDTGQPVVTEIFMSDADRDRLGFGGPGGMDVCFDLPPGYAPTTGTAARAVVARRDMPVGYHGLVSTRPEMLGILLGAGPKLPAGRQWPAVRAIDVAPLVSDLLAIAPPTHATGTSPLAVR